MRNIEEDAIRESTDHEALLGVSQVLGDFPFPHTQEQAETICSQFNLCGTTLADFVEEYRRFLTVAYSRRLQGAVVPSRVVDEMWHFHLAQEDSYHKMCRTIFGGPFGQIPSATQPTVLHAVKTTAAAAAGTTTEIASLRSLPLPDLI